MTPEDIAMIRQILPEETPYHYFPDRQSAWLLSQLMPAEARVGDLRATHFGKLLDRPTVKPLVARCGGVLRRTAVDALANCNWQMPGVADVAFGADAREFDVSLSSWAKDSDTGTSQISRPGGNLVVQINFPAEHASLFHSHLGSKFRKHFEFDSHPIRQTGSPTMAWVRLDIDMDSGVALIEEVQSDWFRIVRAVLALYRRTRPRARNLQQMQAYETQLLMQYGRDWSQAALLAALILLSREMSVRTVFLHQAWCGPAFKRIPKHNAPPRSLYSTLPKSFCFAPTFDAPAFLEKPASKILRRLRGRKKPLFWKLCFA